MRSCFELRDESWVRLWRGRWFGRLLVCTLLLMLCQNVLVDLVRIVLSVLNVQDWQVRYQMVAYQWLADHFDVWAQAMKSAGIQTAVPDLTPNCLFQTTSATALVLFFVIITSGIAEYGYSILLLKSGRADVSRWFPQMFAGFRIPLDLAGLFFARTVVYLLWASLGVCLPLYPLVGWAGRLLGGPVGLTQALSLAGLISLALCWTFFVMSLPYYCYRFLFFLKVDHPDWGVFRCLRECRAMMVGYKWKSFCLDCSYWLAAIVWILPYMIALTAACVGSMCFAQNVMTMTYVMAAVMMLALIASWPINLVVTPYMNIGQALLYLEVKKERNMD